MKSRLIHEKAKRLYSKQYVKSIPSPIQEIEYKQKYFEKNTVLSTKKFKPKNLLMISLGHEHFPKQNGVKIIDLPKSPFGKHESYNGENDFYNKHFPVSGSPKLNSLSKKIAILNKNTKKKMFAGRLTPVPFGKNLEIFDTISGKLFCKQNKSVMKIYEAETKKFQILNLLSIKDLEKQNACENKNGISKSGGYFNNDFRRRLTPSPKFSVFP